MIYHELAALDKKLSQLCLGTMNFGVSLSEAESFDMMDAFAAMGGNFIDTARIYGFDGPGQGTSEKVIGKWLRARGNRAQMIIATKGGHPQVDSMQVGRLDKDALTEDLDASLEALGVDCVDMYWLHRDDESRPVEEILTTLNGFIEAHKVCSIGASNWRPARLREAWGAAYSAGLSGFAADQPLWGLAQSNELGDQTLVMMDADLYQWHQDSHQACMPYTSQSKGFFAKLAEGGEAALSEKALTRYLNDHNLQLFEAVKTMSAETGLSAGAIALAFLTSQREFRVYPIVGASNMKQMEALKEAADAVLTEAQLDALMASTGLIK